MPYSNIMYVGLLDSVVLTTLHPLVLCITLEWLVDETWPLEGNITP